MNELLTLTAAELGERIAARQVSSEEVTQAHLDRISEVDGDIHAFLLVDHAGALDAARRIDARIADGEHLGPLAGVPLACLLYTSPSPRDGLLSRMPSSA